MKLFDRYDLDVEVKDPGLVRYVVLEPSIHTGARYADAPEKVGIIERLINDLMRTEHYTGKKIGAYKVVKGAFALIQQKTKQNPLQALVDALQHTAPKEEATRLRFGGISVPKAVDTSPQRRLNTALALITEGAVRASHKNKKSIVACLADEIITASKGDVSSYAVSKKEQIERVARSAR